MITKIKVGDVIYSPASNYKNDREDFIITKVVEINEETNRIVDSDGDKLKIEWLGEKIGGFFLSQEAMQDCYNESVTTEELWTYACNGDIESLEKSYANGCGINNRYFKFGETHSLIMGAFRNNEYDTVEYLLNKGENLTLKEYEEIQNEVRKLEVMKKMIK